MTHCVVLLASAEQDLKDLKAYLLKNFSSETWGSTYTLIKQEDAADAPTIVRHLAIPLAHAG